jgi:HPt (histidine-containing phosphotransfer) domain-containing protein
VSDADALAAELAALAAEYRGKLAGRLDALDALAAALAGGQTRAARLEDLRRELHTIAGSAKTFGLPAVSTAARAGERLVDPWCDAGATPGVADWAELRSLLAALRRAAGAS